MALDTATLKSSLVADLTREFPVAEAEQIDRVADANVETCLDARVLTFLPILAQEHAGRARRMLTSISDAQRRDTRTTALPDIPQMSPPTV